MNGAEPAVIATRFSDPDRTVEGLRGAELEPCQLSRGRMTSELARVAFPSACLDMVHFGPAMQFRGAMPRDCYTIMFILACPQPGRSFNFATGHTDGYIGFWPPGGEMDGMSPPGYRNATLTLPIKHFEAGLAEYFPDAPERLLTSGAAMRVGAAAQRQLAGVVRAVWELAWDPAHSPASWEAREQIERAVQAAFFAALRSGCEHLVPPPPLRVVGRHRRFRQARDHLAAHLHDPVYLSDLCRATGLCPRALENLFQDFLGLSPMAYLRHLRLHQARRALLRSAPASGVVKQTAPAWGFWHLGHFARDYHALFGESPIATLRR